MQIKDRIIELRRVRAGDLIPNPQNWRTHPKAQADALKGILAEVGYVDALKAVETKAGLMLIDGHLRAETTPDLEVPVLILDVTEAEAKKILATFDPLGAMAEADKDQLEKLLAEVETDSAGLQAMLDDLATDAGIDVGDVEISEDEAPAPPADPVTMPGDLWILGEHRLLCGDSTKAEDVARVMAGEKASCVFTDPPYGVSVAAKNRTLNENPGKNGNRGSGRVETDIVDDDLSPEELEAVLLQAFINCRQHVMADDCTLFVCSPQGCGLSMMMMMMMMQKAGLKARHVLIWMKNQPTFSMGRLDYDYQHEPILLTWGKRHKRPMNGTHKTSVWKVDKPRKSAEHPTMKPVELYANAYLNNSDKGDIVADIYGGSGTSIVAAEQVGRKARLIEIAPQYCDVILSRWSKLTEREPTLEETGETFAQVKARRKG